MILSVQDPGDSALFFKSSVLKNIYFNDVYYSIFTEFFAGLFLNPTLFRLHSNSYSRISSSLTKLLSLVSLYIFIINLLLSDGLI